MFTGIIRHIGRVESLTPAGAGARIAVDLGPLAEGLSLGDSVAINGVCLTVADFGPSGRADFDVVDETLTRTNLGKLRSGSRVNLERALTVSGALDGHIVQGHVDGIARVKSIGRDRRGIWQFEAARELTTQMIPKGSIAIDGVSLTLADVTDSAFSVALIPTTLAETMLGELAVGDSVNIETDVLGKYVVQYLRQIAGPSTAELTPDKLRQAGFM